MLRIMVQFIRTIGFNQLCLIMIILKMITKFYSRTMFCLKFTIMEIKLKETIKQQRMELELKLEKIDKSQLVKAWSVASSRRLKKVRINQLNIHEHKPIISILETT